MSSEKFLAIEVSIVFFDNNEAYASAIVAIVVKAVAVINLSTSPELRLSKACIIKVKAGISEIHCPKNGNRRCGRLLLNAIQ